MVLRPGDYLVVKDNNKVLQTILGSCVSACLFDPLNHIAGMNHFLLSNERYSRTLPFTETEAGRYGVHSMELLINAMMKQGANRKKLEAKAFGGANLLTSPSNQARGFFCVGEVNVRFIKDFLSTEGIPLITSDLGGEQGRVIFFSTHDYTVHVGKIRRFAAARISKEEKIYWKREIEKKKKVPLEAVEIWK